MDSGIYGVGFNCMKLIKTLFFRLINWNYLIKIKLVFPGMDFSLTWYPNPGCLGNLLSLVFSADEKKNKALPRITNRYLIKVLMVFGLGFIF